MFEINWWFVAVPLGVGMVVLLGVLQWRRPDLVGLEGKTAWDLLTLFMAPALIVVATAVVTEMQKQVEVRRAQEAAIQSYVDRISALVLQGTTVADRDRTTAIGRAHTSAVLQLADRERAGRILVFLDELGLIADYVTSLEGFDFTDADLKGLKLDGMDFEDSILLRADLEESSLIWVDFEVADLRGADLKRTAARNANFEGARLDGAELDFADLRGADLSLAAGLTTAQLVNSCLDASTLLPQGFAAVEGETAACGALPATAVEAGEGVPLAEQDDEDDDDDD
jgi:uncharacterized protein YjbI with pentapeptide repeats